MLAGYVLARKSDQALEDGLVDPAVKLAQAAQDDTRQLTPAVHAYAAMTEAAPGHWRVMVMRADVNLTKRPDCLERVPRTEGLTSVFRGVADRVGLVA